MTPSVGRIVHYVAPGSADGTFPPEHRAAIITRLSGKVDDSGYPKVDLAVFNPQGLHFVADMRYDEGGKAYTWHWPERA